MSDSGRVDEDLQFARELNQKFEQSRLEKDESKDSSSDKLDLLSQRVDKAKPILDLLTELKIQRSERKENDGQANWVLDIKRLGRFQIQREIGRGGNGIVFQAIDEQLNRNVALKIPHVDSALSGSSRQRFEREARATAILSHPSIVAIYEFGHDRGLYYIASQYIQGINLARWIESHGRPTPIQSATVVSKLAEAIEHAHQRGVLHRDLKPSNILVEQATDDNAGTLVDHCRIADFGLAVIEEESDDLTMSGALVGTPAYMSPEQTRSRTEQIGPATDVYGLGVVLYHLLVGRAPFGGDDLAMIVEQVRKRDPAAPSAENPAVPRDLDAICVKCLEKKPENRYPSAFELQQDLQRFLDGNPVSARPVSGPVRLMRWMTRYPQTATMILAILGLMLMLTIGSSIAVFSISRSKTRVIEHLNAEAQAKQAANKSATEAQQALFESRLSNAGALILSGRHGQSRKSLESVTAAASLRERLGLNAQQMARMRTLIAGASSLVDVSVERDYEISDPLTSVVHNEPLQLYAVANRNRAEIEIRETDTNIVQRTLTAQKQFYSEPVIVFSRSSRFLGASYKSKDAKWYLAIWDLNRSTDVSWMCLQVPWSAKCRFDFSPDDRFLAYVTTERKLAVVDLVSGNKLATKESGSNLVFKFANQSNLLAAAHSGRLELLEFEGNSFALKTSTPISTRIFDIAWSRDDSRLAAGGSNKLAYVWKTSDLTLKQTLAGHGWQVVSVCFHPNNRLLATYSRDRTTRLWNLETGEQWLQSDEIEVDRFDLTGQWLGTKEGKSRIWINEFHQIIEASIPATQQMSVHPNGRIIVLCKDNLLQLFDLKSGATLLEQTIAGASACFAPCGKKFIIASQFGVFVSDVQVKTIDEELRLRIDRPIQLNDANFGGLLSVDRAGQMLGITIRYPNFGGSPTAGTLELQTGDWFALDPYPQNARWHDLSFDGRFMAVGKWHGRGQVEIWDMKTREVITSLDHKNAQVRFSNDARFLAVDDGSSLTFYRTEDWEPQFERREKVNVFAPLPVAFSNNNRLCAVLGDRRKIEILDVDSFELLFSLSVGDDDFIETLEFTPGDRRLVAGSGKKIHVWNLPLFESLLGDADLSLGLDFGSSGQSDKVVVEFQPDRLKLMTEEFGVSSIIRVVEAHQQILAQNKLEQLEHEAFETFLKSTKGINLELAPSEFKSMYSDLLGVWERKLEYLKTASHRSAEISHLIDYIPGPVARQEGQLQRLDDFANELWAKCLSIQSKLRKRLQ